MLVSRVWRAWPKFSAGCSQARPAENFGLWADFPFLSVSPKRSDKDPLGWLGMCWLSWFSGPRGCSGPGFHLRLGASDCSPALAFCFMAIWAAAWIRCLQLSYHTCKNGTHSTSFYSTGGHTPKSIYCRVRNYYQIISKKALSCNFLR